MLELTLPLQIKGHVLIKELETGKILLDKHNAIHPQNVARAIARALANEGNFYIHRIAFGNGGTFVDASQTITYRTPNDGQLPDIRTWDSRLYRETYSEIIDDSNLNIGTDPGSSGPNVPSRPGGGAVPEGDPDSITHVSGPGVRSNELGLTSEIIISVVLNPGEPKGQFSSDNQSPSEDPESSFSFDELGLYTTGAPGVSSKGYRRVDVGNRTSIDDSGLFPGTTYSFRIAVNSGTLTSVSFTTPVSGGSGTGGEILYGDIAQAINTGSLAWGFLGVNPLPLGATVSITDTSGAFSTFIGAQTYGFLTFESPTSGSASKIALNTGTTGIDMFGAFENSVLSGSARLALTTSVDGKNAGVQNNPVSSTTERERLLTHLIFSPILKSANRSIQITYTLTVSVERAV